MNSINTKVRYIVVVTLLLGIVLLLSPFKVMADTSANPTLTLSYVGAEGAKISDYTRKVNTFTQTLSGFNLIKFEDKGITSGSTGTGQLSLDFTEYTNLRQEEKTEIMGYALDSIKDSGMSTVASNRIYNFIQSQDSSTASLVRQLSNDVDADFAEAYMMFKPFSGALGILLGCFAIAIFVALTLMILVDLSYIVIPLVRDFLTPASADAKPKFVSNEAWYAVKEVDSANNTDKNVLLVYFKKKVMQFVALSICILYLLSGQIYVLIGSLMDMFRGVLG